MELEESQSNQLVGKEILKASYQVSESDFVSYNFLLAHDKLNRTKRATSRNLLLVSIFCLMYYLFFLRGQKSSFVSLKQSTVVSLLLILWSVIFVCFLFGHLVWSRWLNFLARRLFKNDEYNEKTITATLFEDRFVEKLVDAKVAILNEITLVLSNDEVYVIYTKEKQVFIIPNNKATLELIKEIDKRVGEDVVRNRIERKRTRDIVKQCFKEDL